MESSFLGFRLLISTLFLTLRADGLVIECRSSAWPESHRGDPRAQSVAMANRLLASLNHLTMDPPHKPAPASPPRSFVDLSIAILEAFYLGHGQSSRSMLPSKVPCVYRFFDFYLQLALARPKRHFFCLFGSVFHVFKVFQNETSVFFGVLGCWVSCLNSCFDALHYS